MADEPGKSTSWWATMPGILTALAGIITALTGLVAILVQTGIIGNKEKPASSLVGAPASTSSSSSTPPAAKAGEPAGAPPAAVSAAPKPANDGVATGVSDMPIARANFTGAVVTMNDGSVVRVRDEIREYCAGRPQLTTTLGQTIEMQRMKRFDVSDWRGGKGAVHIVLNNGESLDAKFSACYFVGVNDLGEIRADFENIRSVEFVR